MNSFLLADQGNRTVQLSQGNFSINKRIFVF